MKADQKYSKVVEIKGGGGGGGGLYQWNWSSNYGGGGGYINEINEFQVQIESSQ